MLHPVVAKDAPQWQTERTIDQTRGKQKNKVRLRLCTNGETASPYVHCPSIQLPGHPDMWMTDHVPWFLSYLYVQLPYRIHSTSRFSTIGLQAILKPGWSDQVSDNNYSWSKKERLHSAECVYGKQQRTGLGAWVLQVSCFSCFCLKTSCVTPLSILTCISQVE